MLEPREGQFEFAWMDRLLDTLAKNDISAALATPSGAKPNWMAFKYPEIRRVEPSGGREHQGGRHNHCYTSPVYRQKCTLMNTRLAERYGKHPAVAMWHVSNEYGGDCHCDLCKAAFRKWLQAKYKTLDALNHAYWSRFWSHTFGDWNEVDWLDGSVHALGIDWKRFVTHQTVDFFRHESAPLRGITPDIPITVNMMGMYEPLNYWKFAPYVDVIAWDSYPRWHCDKDLYFEAGWTAFVHDLNRSIRQRPFMLIESTPSITNWAAVSPLKRPGVHRLTSLQAIAHGSDSVLYFQWRKSRGSCEKFHGAVVDHVGHENTRVFREVAELGDDLAKLKEVAGTMPKPPAAVIFDWENRWAFNVSAGPRNLEKLIDQTGVEHYLPLWRRGISCDVIDSEQPFDRYKLLIAPMLYMIRPGVAERMAKFVEAGGTLVMTYCSAIADETDLCFLGGTPGGKHSPLRKALGIWSEELDALPDSRAQSIVADSANSTGLSGSYAARHYCDLIHLEGAKSLATYANDFYAGRPAVTVNNFGKGKAYYVASRNDARFMDDFIGSLSHDLPRAVAAELPPGVSAVAREADGARHIFLMNFSESPAKVDLDKDHQDVLNGGIVRAVELKAYDARVLKIATNSSRAASASDP
jgi:beta-galactosidase